VAIDTSVLKVDTRLSVWANDDLQLVVPRVSTVVPQHAPSVRTRSNLNAIHHLIASTQEVGAKFANAIDLVVIETNDEQGWINYTKATGVVLVGFDQRRPERGPDFAVLGCKEADCVLCNTQDGRLVGVFDDGRQVLQDFLWAEDRTVLRIKAVEPVWR
jgi:hypothetical protein